MSNLDAKASYPAIIWWGQIVDDVAWKENRVDKKWRLTGDLEGWGDRYKVRILGRDTDTKDVADDQLEWAEVIYPVTAGSGHRGCYQTSNLSKGSYVVGFYKDGIQMTEPVILGCLGNNDQTRLSQTIPLRGFVPFSGYITERVSVNSIPAEGSKPESTDPHESCTNSTANRTVFSDQVTYDECKKEIPLASSNDCDKLQLGKIQIEIKKFIQDIQNFKNQINSWKNTLLKPISENGKQYSIEEYIQYKIQNVSQFIAGGIKKIIVQIQKYITRKINAGMKDLYDKLYPDQRATAKTGIETANDLIACLFKKIISNLLKMVGRFLLAIAERFINAPLCAVENIIGALLGKLTGLISSAIQAIMAPVNAILGVVDIAGDIIGFIADVLSFLSCEEKPDCPQVAAWSIWEGPTKFNFGADITGIINKVKSFASSVQQSVDPDNFDFDLDFSDIFQDTCNVGPIFCGPPIVEFYGGGGFGAAGNAIINAAGDILGVDLVSSGSGYQSAPMVKFIDNCGKGKGAVGRVILGPIRTGDDGSFTNGVVGVVMENSGSNYLPSPNGDRGGDGRVWSTAEQTTVKRADGKYDRPYNPGENIDVGPEDEVYSCGNSTTITQTQTITAPECTISPPPPGQDPSLNNGEYPVILELDDGLVEDPGINYDPEEDKIEITPDNGAELQPEFDDNGSLTRVVVVKKGVGFTQIPDIRIKTRTGYNAKILPLFKVNRNLQNVPVLSGQIISVVDCVGRV